MSGRTQGSAALQGKVAVVTGSAENLGLGIALRLARDGARVVINGLAGAQVEGADVAAAVAFLCSDEAAYITGQVLAVDGGLGIQLRPPGAELRPPGDGTRLGDAR